jgi:hypothetical protein
VACTNASQLFNRAQDFPNFLQVGAGVAGPAAAPAPVPVALVVAAAPAPVPVPANTTLVAEVAKDPLDPLPPPNYAPGGNGYLTPQNQKVPGHQELCAQVCRVGTWGPCQHDNPKDDTCIAKREVDNRCPLGTIDCSEVEYPQKSVACEDTCVAPSAGPCKNGLGICFPRGPNNECAHETVDCGGVNVGSMELSLALEQNIIQVKRAEMAMLLAKKKESKPTVTLPVRNPWN